MDGSKLKKLREQKGYSLTKLSKLTGISKSYLSLIERGIHKNPSIEILEKIAISLEVDVEYIVKSEDEVDHDNSGKSSVKGVLKLEIELTDDQLSPRKLEHIKKLIDVINTD